MKGRKPISEFKDFKVSIATLNSKVSKKKADKKPLLKPKENSSFLDLRENISDMIDNMSVCLDDTLIFETPTFTEKYTPEEIVSEEVIITEDFVETVEETKEFYPDVFDGLEEEHARISTYLKSMRKNEDFSKENDLVEIPERDVNSYLTTLDKLSTINEQQTDFLEKNKEFVTFDEMKDHYRLFARNVQIQLSSLGGGGVGASDVLQMINSTPPNLDSAQIDRIISEIGALDSANTINIINDTVTAPYINNLVNILDSANTINIINDTVTAPYINNLVNILDSANVQSIITSDGLLSRSGGLMTGDINMGNNIINALPTPTSPSEAVNKIYVDQRPPGLRFEYETGSSTTDVSSGKFQYYLQSGALKLKFSNISDSVQWNNTTAGTVSTSSLFTIYYQFNNGSWIIKKQGTISGLVYSSGECLVSIASVLNEGDLFLDTNYFITIAGIL